jgi:hypothetical protein
MSLLAASGASAQSMWSIDQREASQEQRVRAGIRDGSLTRSEASRLQQGDQRIDRYEARAKSDGVVTHAERQRLDGMLDRQGRAIHRERTDGQRADGHNGWGGRDGHGGRDNNRGNHYGWDNNRGNHNGWGNNDHNRGGVNRPEHSTHTGQPPTGTHTGWNGGTRGQPQATTPPANTHTGWNGGTRGQPQATTPPANTRTGWNGGTRTQPPAQTTPANTHTRPTTSHNQGGRMIQASAPAPRTATSANTMNTTNNGGRNSRR